MQDQKNQKSLDLAYVLGLYITPWANVGLQCLSAREECIMDG